MTAARDFRTGEPIKDQTFFDDHQIDIHHIFPERWCKDNDRDPATYNSVINKTAISARTNRQIGGRAPSEYLPAVERAAGIEPGRMDDILASHCIASLSEKYFTPRFGNRLSGRFVHTKIRFPPSLRSFPW